MTDVKAVDSMTTDDDDVQAADDPALQQLLQQRTSPIRKLRVKTPYGGGLLADVLIARRVLSLELEIDEEPQPLMWRPNISAEALPVTTLEVHESARAIRASSAAPVAALILSFPSLTALTLSTFSDRFPSAMTIALCGALQSARAPLLERFELIGPDFRDGAGAQFAQALRMRLAQSLAELQVRQWIGSDAEGAEIIRALNGASRLQSLQFIDLDDDPGGATATEVAKLLVGNNILTALRLKCDESKLATSPLFTLADAVRSNPRSALTRLDADNCTPNEEGGAALVSLIALPRIDQLDLSLSGAQAAVRRSAALLPQSTALCTAV
jgi:hypothetical protein